MMPPLLEKVCIGAGYFDTYLFAYTEDQMREYGQACADAERERLEFVNRELIDALSPFVITNSSEEHVTLVVRSADITKARASISKVIVANHYQTLAQVSNEPPEMFQENPCKPHPDAPHGVDVNASFRTGRTVCICQSWKPGDES